MSLLRILVAGYGYIGEHLVHRLLQADHHVSIVRRSQQTVQSKVTPYFIDLALSKHLRCLPTDFDLCYFLVAPDSSSQDAYQTAYIRCLENLLSHFSRESRCQTRMVLASSTAVYHQSDGSWVDESSSTAPQKFQGQVLLEAESLLLQAWQRSHVVRFSGIYGPNRYRLIDQVKKGIVGTERLAHFSNRIHRDDCSGLLDFISRHENFPKLVNGTDDEPTKLAEIYAWLAARLGIENPPGPASAALELAPLQSNKRVSNRLLRETGYILHFPSFREGFNIASNLDK